ncbi:MAG: hypothetical protein FD127_1850 [Acidimicrobiaceae bacterium]|nr:MAG: hypothetical protein FD127_1850 [Acidimicrobiaceae bacterium]
MRGGLGSRQNLSINVLMIHSPLVGPMTLHRLGARLHELGFEVVVPDLRGALTGPRPQWRAILDLAIAAASSVDVIVAHSGAGVLMPLLAEQLSPEVVAFVDAVVPGDGLTYQASDPFIEFVDSLSHDGPLLPPWHEWWGDDVTARLIPDGDLRDQIAADTPRVPRSFYDDPVPLPSSWMTRHGCCFLQLSPAYDDDRARAEAYEWPTARMAGQHLDVAVKPFAVGESLMSLIERARSH